MRQRLYGCHQLRHLWARLRLGPDVCRRRLYRVRDGHEQLRCDVRQPWHRYPQLWNVRPRLRHWADLFERCVWGLCDGHNRVWRDVREPLQ